jgi:putative heme transporter
VTAPAPSGVRRIARRLLVPLLGLVIVVGIFAAVIPRIASYQAAWQHATHLAAGDWVLIAVSIVANVLTSGPPWMAAVPGLGYRRSMLLTQTATMMTTVLPLGEAVGFATQVTMLRRWQFSPHTVTAGLVIVATWNQVANIVIPMVALVAVGSGDGDQLLRTISVIAGCVAFAVIGAVAVTLRNERETRAVGDLAARLASRALALVHRPPRRDWGERLVRMRSETIDVVSRRWLMLTVSTLANQLTLFGVLLACVHATGISGVSFWEALAAWSFARLISSIAITPGGLGIQELGLTGGLIAFGGGNDRVVAAALLYRVLTFVPIVVVGSASALIWRREDRSAPPDPAAAEL